MIPIYALFHLNLAYSSIPVDERKTVIDRCYSPLLDLLFEHEIYAGIEMSGWTLQQISVLAPEWLVRFKSLLQAGRCELIGSGYAQIIGPLIPYEVNVWNQRIGLEDYQNMLGIRPRLILVNELAYSSGLVGIYREAGYEGMLMDRDNVALALSLTNNDDAMPVYADSGDGEGLPVLWIDSILFQTFQRYAHGDIGMSDYLHYFKSRINEGDGPFAIYGNDAEIFDYRPGRFKEESELDKNNGEWHRIHQLVSRLKEQKEVVWRTPSDALREFGNRHSSRAVTLTSARQPIPVKKQAKYNISRWAITGRDDLWINTLCHQIYRQIRLVANNTKHEKWRGLCRLWASDLRTHVTSSRWNEALGYADDLLQQLNVRDFTPNQENFSLPLPHDNNRDHMNNCHIHVDPESIYITVETSNVIITLNKRRGLAIHSLGFKQHDFSPLIGTLPLGYFSSIDLGADFYSGGVIIERVKEHSRTTDLTRVVPDIIQQEDQCIIRCVIDTDDGDIVKTICISKISQSITIHYNFPSWRRPYGSVRVGNFTFLPKNFSRPLYFLCRNGGRDNEEFKLDADTFHTNPASSLVSASG
ncbi:MAG: glycoside hydrolase family 57, partial [Thiohalomonadales bacterium]